MADNHDHGKEIQYMKMSIKNEHDSRIERSMMQDHEINKLKKEVISLQRKLGLLMMVVDGGNGEIGKHTHYDELSKKKGEK